MSAAAVGRTDDECMIKRVASRFSSFDEDREIVLY